MSQTHPDRVGQENTPTRLTIIVPRRIFNLKHKLSGAITKRPHSTNISILSIVSQKRVGQGSLLWGDPRSSECCLIRSPRGRSVEKVFSTDGLESVSTCPAWCNPATHSGRAGLVPRCALRHGQN